MSCSPFRISKRSSPRCLGDLDAGSKLKLRRPQSKTMSNGYGNMGDGIIYFIKAIIIGAIILAAITFGIGVWLF